MLKAIVGRDIWQVEKSKRKGATADIEMVAACSA